MGRQQNEKRVETAGNCP